MLPHAALFILIGMSAGLVLAGICVVFCCLVLCSIHVKSRVLLRHSPQSMQPTRTSRMTIWCLARTFTHGDADELQGGQ